MAENMTKVYLTDTELRALCFAACHREEAGGLALEAAFALKDAILKLKGTVPPDPARLTHAELGELADAIDGLGRSRVAVLGSPALVRPLQEALGKIHMALYPEMGTPQ